MRLVASPQLTLCGTALNHLLHFCCALDSAVGDEKNGQLLKCDD